jgi:hypothetical protein
MHGVLEVLEGVLIGSLKDVLGVLPEVLWN